MPVAELRLIKRCAEWQDKDQIPKIAHNTRDIYVLLKQRAEAFDVVYIGMACGEQTGINNRLEGHARSRRKGPE